MTTDDRAPSPLLAAGLMTVNEAAKFLGMGRTWVYAQMHAGRLSYVRLGSNRRVPRAEVLQLAEKGLIVARNPDG